MVEKLVKEHITQKDSLILIAMPMTGLSISFSREYVADDNSDDIQNQGAVALAKSVDPKGQRIVGMTPFLIR